MPKGEKGQNQEPFEMSRREFLRSALSAMGLISIGALTFLSSCRNSTRNILLAPNNPTETPSPTTTTPAPGPVVTPSSGPPTITAVPTTTGANVAAGTLVIDGLVDNSMVLSYEALLQLPSKAELVTLICPGAFEETKEWTGVPLSAILAQASVKPTATQVSIYAGNYVTTLPLQETASQDIILAYEADGEKLTQDGGYPLRLVLPNMAGNYWVRWVDHLALS